MKNFHPSKALSTTIASALVAILTLGSIIYHNVDLLTFVAMLVFPAWVFFVLNVSRLTRFLIGLMVAGFALFVLPTSEYLIFFF